MTVGLGSPVQQLCLVPSTVVNNTLIIGTDDCPDSNSTLEQCSVRYGGLFNVSEAGSSFTKVPLSILAPDPDWVNFASPLPGFTLAGNTTMQLSYEMPVSNFPVAVITEGTTHNVGQLGLSVDSVFLDLLNSTGSVHGFGLNAGSQSVLNPRSGSLVIGGYDQASINGIFTNYSVTYHSIGRVCPFQVNIEKLVLRRPGVKDIELSSEGSEIPACIEP
jgi:hypothetical protein